MWSGVAYLSVVSGREPLRHLPTLHRNRMCRVVGARFERANLMEWKHLIVTQEQNTASNGYGGTADPNTSEDAALLKVHSAPTPHSMIPRHFSPSHLSPR